MLDSQTEEIKTKLSVEEVLSGYMQMQKAGRNFKAKCPFHNEKTPSFMISPERQSWHCFGCNEGGDIFTFIMKIEGLEFYDALKLLAERAGVQIKSHSPANDSKKKNIFEIVEISRKFFQECLKIKNGKVASEYLQNRGLTEDIIEKFQLGYAPDSWDLLSNFLKKKGYDEIDIAATGMTVKKDRGGYYDRFRNRIMFPINNIGGQTIGFSSRVMPGEDESQAKYINTPETLIYNKGRVLYGLDKAKNEIRQKDLCIMVEGNMDVIASFQAKVENVVATSGTALTTDQIRIIKRYTKNIAFSFDMDSAGIKAANKGIEMALAEDISVNVITIPEGKDPADCVKNNPKLWEKAVQNPKLIMEFYFESVFSKYNSDNIDDKKKIAEELLRIISNISNDIDRGYYRNQLSDKLGLDEKIIFEYENKIKREKSGFINRDDTNNVEETKATTRENQLQQRILGFIILYPQFFQDLFLDLEKYLLNAKINTVYNLVKSSYLKEEKLDDEILLELRDKISTQGNTKDQGGSLSHVWNVAALSVEERIDEISDAYKEAKTCVINLKQILLKKDVKELEIKMKGGALQEDIEKFDKLYKELNNLDIK
ncbi:MAG: DNA primase [Candidatus Pacebacteria bacterium]|nr:DNA primase [Candidatus Paceibacterota bacterium]